MLEASISHVSHMQDHWQFGDFIKNLESHKNSSTIGIILFGGKGSTSRQ